MVDFLSIVADSFIIKMLKFLFKRIKDFNVKIKNKKLVQNFMDLYSGKL